MSNESCGTDGRESDNPPQHLLDNRQERLSKRQHRLGGLAHLDRCDTEGNGHEQQLQNVKARGRGQCAL